MAKPRVIQIITKLELGGAQEVALYLAGGLDRSRWDVTLISGEKGELSAEARRGFGKDFIELPSMVREISPVNDLRALIGLYGILRRIVRESPAGVVVHTHSSKAGILGRLAARLAGATAVVHTIHGFGFNDDQSWPRKALFVTLEKLCASATDRFIAVAHDNVKKGIREGIFPEEKAVVVRAGIDTAYFAAAPGDTGGRRADIGIPGGAPVVTMVSCLKPQKAPVDFVRVAARVFARFPDAHFVHAGDGELRGEMEAEAKRLGLNGHLHMLGWRRDVKELMHMSDVMVLTSLWEGLPKVLPQAMAAGKPVVATAVDGTPEAVRDGVNGFLANPHDIEYMADKVALLLTDRTLAARMGEAGRAMVHEFDEAESLARVEALYDTLLK